MEPGPATGRPTSTSSERSDLLLLITPKAPLFLPPPLTALPRVLLSYPSQDIAWFHAVIWPCMLFSAQVPLPKRIVCHGFVNGPDGRKMSKSWGNIIDPVSLLKEYNSPDIIRYFMLREGPLPLPPSSSSPHPGSFGADFAFNVASLRDRHDTELAANLGNLAARALNLAGAYCEGKVPAETAAPLFDMASVATELEKEFQSLSLQFAVQRVFGELASVNKWLADEAPWLLKSDEHAVKRRSSAHI